MDKFETVESYLDSLPEMQRQVAQIMRELLADVAPEAQETISYNMPAIRQNGKVLVYFATTAHHLGLYPTSDPIVAFEKELANFETSKGTIKIPYDRPLPVKLIRAIIEYRIKQVTR